MPFVPFEDYAIMRNRYIMPVDGIVMEPFRCNRPGFQVDHELMAVQIEVYPGIGAAPFLTAEDIPIKSPGLLEIINWNGNVEGCDFFHYFKGKYFLPMPK